jgi:PRTRC genetic system ThiF family protein
MTRIHKLSVAEFSNIIIVGCGGTGGYLVPNLVRYLASRPNRDQYNVVLVDGDEVETKNVGRQNFIQTDVGKNKAQVLAERYSAAFGVNISYYPHYLESKEAIVRLYQGSGGRPFLVSCVDNNKTRQLFDRWFHDNTNRSCYIDSGNEEYFGQVVLGYGRDYKGCNKFSGRTRNDSTEFYLPPVGVRYPSILSDTKSKFASEESCAERAISAPQSIMANITAANCILNMMIKIIQDSWIDYSELRFDTLTGEVRTVYNTMEELFPKPPDLSKVDMGQILANLAFSEANETKAPVRSSTMDTLRPSAPAPARPELSETSRRASQRVQEVLSANAEVLSRDDDFARAAQAVLESIARR